VPSISTVCVFYHRRSFLRRMVSVEVIRTFKNMQEKAYFHKSFQWESTLLIDITRFRYFFHRIFWSDNVNGGALFSVGYLRTRWNFGSQRKLPGAPVHVEATR
jgi:hypothetical protein